MSQLLENLTDWLYFTDDITGGLDEKVPTREDESGIQDQQRLYLVQFQLCTLGLSFALSITWIGCRELCVIYGILQHTSLIYNKRTRRSGEWSGCMTGTKSRIAKSVLLADRLQRRRYSGSSIPKKKDKLLNTHVPLGAGKLQGHNVQRDVRADPAPSVALSQITKIHSYNSISTLKDISDICRSEIAISPHKLGKHSFLDRGDAYNTQASVAAILHNCNKLNVDNRLPSNLQVYPHNIEGPFASVLTRNISFFQAKVRNDSVPLSKNDFQLRKSKTAVLASNECNGSSVNAIEGLVSNSPYTPPVRFINIDNTQAIPILNRLLTGTKDSGDCVSWKSGFKPNRLSQVRDLTRANTELRTLFSPNVDDATSDLLSGDLHVIVNKYALLQETRTNPAIAALFQQIGLQKSKNQDDEKNNQVDNKQKAQLHNKKEKGKINWRQKKQEYFKVKEAKGYKQTDYFKHYMDSDESTKALLCPQNAQLLLSKIANLKLDNTSFSFKQLFPDLLTSRSHVSPKEKNVTKPKINSDCLTLPPDILSESLLTQTSQIKSAKTDQIDSDNINRLQRMGRTHSRTNTRFNLSSTSFSPFRPGLHSLKRKRNFEVQGLHEIPKRFHEIPKRLQETPKRLHEIPKKLHVIPKRIQEIPKTLQAFPQSLQEHTQILHKIPCEESHLRSTQETQNCFWTGSSCMAVRSKYPGSRTQDASLHSAVFSFSHPQDTKRRVGRVIEQIKQFPRRMNGPIHTKTSVERYRPYIIPECRLKSKKASQKCVQLSKYVRKQTDQEQQHILNALTHKAYCLACPYQDMCYCRDLKNNALKDNAHLSADWKGQTGTSYKACDAVAFLNIFLHLPKYLHKQQQNMVKNPPEEQRVHPSYISNIKNDKGAVPFASRKKCAREMINKKLLGYRKRLIDQKEHAATEIQTSCAWNKNVPAKPIARDVTLRRVNETSKYGLLHTLDSLRNDSQRREHTDSYSAKQVVPLKFNDDVKRNSADEMIFRFEKEGHKQTAAPPHSEIPPGYSNILSKSCNTTPQTEPLPMSTAMQYSQLDSRLKESNLTHIETNSHSRPDITKISQSAIEKAVPRQNEQQTLTQNSGRQSCIIKQRQISVSEPKFFRHKPNLPPRYHHNKWKDVFPRRSGIPMYTKTRRQTHPPTMTQSKEDPRNWKNNRFTTNNVHTNKLIGIGDSSGLIPCNRSGVFYVTGNEAGLRDKKQNNMKYQVMVSNILKCDQNKVHASDTGGHVYGKRSTHQQRKNIVQHGSTVVYTSVSKHPKWHEDLLVRPHLAQREDTNKRQRPLKTVAMDTGLFFDRTKRQAVDQGSDISNKSGLTYSWPRRHDSSVNVKSAYDLSKNMSPNNIVFSQQNMYLSQQLDNTERVLTHITEKNARFFCKKQGLFGQEDKWTVFEHARDDNSFGCKRGVNFSSPEKTFRTGLPAGSFMSDEALLFSSEILKGKTRNVMCQASEVSVGSGIRTVEPGTREVDPCTRRVEPGTREVDPCTRTVKSGMREVEPYTRTMKPGTREVEPCTRTVKSGTREVDPCTRMLKPGTKEVEPCKRKVKPDTMERGLCTDAIRTGTKEMRLGTREMGLGTREMGLSTKEMGLGTKEMGLGTREMRQGVREITLGTREMGLGTRAMGLGTKDMGLGTKEMELGTRKMIQGAKEIELGSREMGLGTKEMGLSTRGMRQGAREMELGTREMGLGTRGIGLGTREIRLGTRDVRQSAREIELITREIGFGTREMGLSTQEIERSTREVRLGTREVRFGTRELRLGTREMRLGTREMGFGTREVGLGIKEKGLGTREVRLGTRDVRLGTREMGLSPTGMGLSTREFRFGTREIGSGTREMGSGTRDMGSGTREMRSGTREMGSGTREMGSGTRDMGSGTREMEQIEENVVSNNHDVSSIASLHKVLTEKEIESTIDAPFNKVSKSYNCMNAIRKLTAHGSTARDVRTNRAMSSRNMSAPTTKKTDEAFNIINDTASFTKRKWTQDVKSKLSCAGFKWLYNIRDELAQPEKFVESRQDAGDLGFRSAGISIKKSATTHVWTTGCPAVDETVYANAGDISENLTEKRPRIQSLDNETQDNSFNFKRVLKVPSCELVSMKPDKDASAYERTSRISHCQHEHPISFDNLFYGLQTNQIRPILVSSTVSELGEEYRLQHPLLTHAISQPSLTHHAGVGHPMLAHRTELHQPQLPHGTDLQQPQIAHGTDFQQERNTTIGYGTRRNKENYYKYASKQKAMPKDGRCVHLCEMFPCKNRDGLLKPEKLPASRNRLKGRSPAVSNIIDVAIRCKSKKIIKSEGHTQLEGRKQIQENIYTKDTANKVSIHQTSNSLPLYSVQIQSTFPNTIHNDKANEVIANDNCISISERKSDRHSTETPTTTHHTCAAPCLSSLNHTSRCDMQTLHDKIQTSPNKKKIQDRRNTRRFQSQKETCIFPKASQEMQFGSNGHYFAPRKSTRCKGKLRRHLCCVPNSFSKLYTSPKHCIHQPQLPMATRSSNTRTLSTVFMEKLSLLKHQNNITPTSSLRESVCVSAHPTCISSDSLENIAAISSRAEISPTSHFTEVDCHEEGPCRRTKLVWMCPEVVPGTSLKTPLRRETTNKMLLLTRDHSQKEHISKDKQANKQADDTQIVRPNCGEKQLDASTVAGSESVTKMVDQGKIDIVPKNQPEHVTYGNNVASMNTNSLKQDTRERKKHEKNVNIS